MTALGERLPMPQNKRERTRRRVLLAAHEAYESIGYERASFEEIGERAQVSASSVYSHFGTRERLAVAYLNVVFDALEEDLAIARTRTTALARVLAAADVYLEHVISYPAACRIAHFRAFEASMPHEDAAAARLDRRQAAAVVVVARDLRDAMRAGEIPTAPIQDTMVLFWGACHGVALSVARCDSLTIPPGVARSALGYGREILEAMVGSALPPPRSPAGRQSSPAPATSAKNSTRSSTT